MEYESLSIIVSISLILSFKITCEAAIISSLEGDFELLQATINNEINRIIKIFFIFLHLLSKFWRALNV